MVTVVAAAAAAVVAAAVVVVVALGFSSSSGFGFCLIFRIILYVNCFDITMLYT